MKQFVYALVLSLTLAPVWPIGEAHADSRLERREDRINDRIKDNKKEIAELNKQISQVSRDLARCRAEVTKLRGRSGTIRPPKSESDANWGDIKDGKDEKDKFDWGKTPVDEGDSGDSDEVANKEAYCEQLQSQLDDLRSEVGRYRDGIDQYERDIEDLYKREERRPDEDCVDCSARKASPNSGKSGWEVFADVLRAATPLGLGGMNTWLGYKGMKMGQQDYRLYASAMMAQGLPIQPNANSYGGILGSVTGANAMLSMFMNGWGGGAGNMYGGPFMGGGIGMGGGFYPGMGMGMGYAPMGMGMGMAAGSAFVSGFAAGGGYAPYSMGMGGMAPMGMGMGYAPMGVGMGMGYAPYSMGMGGMAPMGMGMGYAPYSMGMGGGVGMAPMSIGMGQSFNGFVPYNMGGAYNGGFAPYSMGAAGGYAPYSMGMGGAGYAPYSMGMGGMGIAAGSAFVSGFAAGMGYAPYGQTFVPDSGFGMPNSGFGPIPGTYPGYPGGIGGGFPGGNPGSFPYANPMYGVNPNCYGGMCSYNPYFSGINGQYNAGGLPNFYQNQQQQLGAQMRAIQQQGLLGQDAQVAQQAMQEAQARYQYVTGQMTGSYYAGGNVGYGGAGYTPPYYSSGGGYFGGGNNTTVPSLNGSRQ